MAVDEINQAGGINGVKLKIVFEDSAGLNQQAALAMQKMADVYKVPFVLVNISGPALAAAPIASSAKILLINTSATTLSLEKINPYTWSSCSLNPVEQITMARYLSTQYGYTKGAYFSNDAAEGVSSIQVFQQAFKATGGQVDSVLAPRGQLDYTPYLTKIKSLNSDFVYILFSGGDQTIILKQARQMGLKARLVGNNGMAEASVIQSGGDAANGVVYTTVGVADWANSAKGKTFVALYQAKYNASPSRFAPLNYDVVKSVLGPMIKTLSSSGKSINGDNLTNLMKTQTVFTGEISGDTQMLPSRQWAVQQVSVVEIVNRANVINHVYSVADVVKIMGA
jgi:branched-chain amino acid transport system substrate-binding protein